MCKYSAFSNTPAFLAVRRNRCHSEVLEKGTDREACCENTTRNEKESDVFQI